MTDEPGTVSAVAATVAGVTDPTAYSVGTVLSAVDEGNPTFPVHSADADALMAMDLVASPEKLTVPLMQGPRTRVA